MDEVLCRFPAMRVRPCRNDVPVRPAHPGDRVSIDRDERHKVKPLRHNDTRHVPHRAGDGDAVNGDWFRTTLRYHIEILPVPSEAAWIEQTVLLHSDPSERRTALYQFGQLEGDRAADVAVDEEIAVRVVRAGRRLKVDRILCGLTARPRPDLSIRVAARPAENADEHREIAGRRIDRTITGQSARMLDVNLCNRGRSAVRTLVGV